MSRTGKTNQRGYTLLELLVALGVIGLMASVLPALFTGFLPRVELRTVADEVTTEILSARTQAKLSGQTVSVSAETLETRGYQVTILSHPDFDDSSTENITFYPNGRSSGGVIRLSKGDREISITVDWLTGRVGGDQNG